MQEKNLARRYALQKQAAFNLGVAEALSEKKHARPEKEPAKAYIFQRRPLTPPRYLKQQQLQGYLTKQVIMVQLAEWLSDPTLNVVVLSTHLEMITPITVNIWLLVI